MSRIASTILVALFASIIGVLAGNSLTSPQSTQTTKKETAFENVIKTNSLRCAYLVLPPQLIRDPNSNQFSGISFDVVNEAARRLEIKVEWKEEVNFATVAEGFASKRYDAFCLTAYRWGPAARVMEYTNPIFYSTTNVYVRALDTRFDQDLSLINSENVTIATIDGEAAQLIKDQDFPKAKTYSMPQNTDLSLLMEALANGKADIVLANPLMVMPYLVSNPDKVRKIETQKPIRIYAHALTFGKGEHDLESMFNLVLDEMRLDGTIDKILDKYEALPNSFVRIKPPVFR